MVLTSLCGMVLTSWCLPPFVRCCDMSCSWDYLTDHDPMGRVVIDLATLDEDVVHRSWHPLECMAGQQKQAQGDLRLQIMLSTPGRLSEKLQYMIKSFDFVEVTYIYNPFNIGY